jgi:hypothetical protein
MWEVRSARRQDASAFSRGCLWRGQVAGKARLGVRQCYCRLVLATTHCRPLRKPSIMLFSTSMRGFTGSPGYLNRNEVPLIKRIS